MIQLFKKKKSALSVHIITSTTTHKWASLDIHVPACKFQYKMFTKNFLLFIHEGDDVDVLDWLINQTFSILISLEHFTLQRCKNWEVNVFAVVYFHDFKDI